MLFPVKYLLHPINFFMNRVVWLILFYSTKRLFYKVTFVCEEMMICASIFYIIK